MGVVGDGDERAVRRHILQPHYLPIGEELENDSDDGSQKTIIQPHVSLFEARSLDLDSVGYHRASERQQVYLEGRGFSHCWGVFQIGLTKARHPAVSIISRHQDCDRLGVGLASVLDLAFHGEIVPVGFTLLFGDG